MPKRSAQEQNGSAHAPGGHDRFVSRTVTVLALVTLTAGLATVAVLGIGVLLAAFAGVLIAVVLSGLARLLARHSPLPYGWSLTLVVVAILLALSGAGWLLGAQLVEQAGEFGQLLPEVVREVEAWLEQRAWGQWVLERAQDGGQQGAAEGAVAGGLGLLGWLADVSSYLLVAIFVGLFGASNPQLYTDGIVSLTPPRHRDRMRTLLGDLGHTLRWWLVGQGMAMVVIGVSTTIVLFAFGVPLALVVGLIVGLLGFIPYLGPIVGLVPVALVAATAGVTTLLWVLLTYTAVQMLEGYVATPLILERTVYLPPVFTIIMQILLGAALGVKGIVLATPLAAVLLVFARHYRGYIEG